MPRLSGRSIGTILALCAAPVACGGGAAPPTTPADPSTSPSTSEASAGTRIRDLLQGTWEIAGHAPESTLPQEAQPLMTRLFDTLRIRFDGGTATVSTGAGDKESTPFAIEDEQGEAFTLRTHGGMFDGARCRMQGDDTWEATVAGAAWAGKTTLRRAKAK